MRLGTLINGQFKIPAGAGDHVVKAEMTTSADVTLRSLLPHTHLRGKSWEYTAIYPDGRSEVLLSVPKYDFNWQTEYVFAEPLKLPKGTTIRAVAHYDNSHGNKDNPDPSVEVAWGDQTWEEMMFTAFVYSIDGVAPGHRRHAAVHPRRTVARHSAGPVDGRWHAFAGALSSVVLAGALFVLAGTLRPSPPTIASPPR